MEGTIKIEAISNMGVSVEMDVRNISRIDMMGIFDALAKGFKLDEKDRKIFGLVFAAGGLEATGAAKSMTIELDKDLLKIFEMMKGNSDEHSS